MTQLVATSEFMHPTYVTELWSVRAKVKICSTNLVWASWGAINTLVLNMNNSKFLCQPFSPSCCFSLRVCLSSRWQVVSGLICSLFPSHPSLPPSLLRYKNWYTPFLTAHTFSLWFWPQSCMTFYNGMRPNPKCSHTVSSPRPSNLTPQVIMETIKVWSEASQRQRLAIMSDSSHPTGLQCDRKKKPRRVREHWDQDANE